jgi:uncharacterized membrane protein
MTGGSWAIENAWLLVAAMVITAAALRFGGFWFMRFVPMTPRLRAGLAAMPLAVMLGILLPPALKGGVAEWAGIAIAAGLTWIGRNELVALLAGMATVATVRWLQV